VSFGYLADRYNRKYTYIAYLAVPALLVPVFALVRSANALLFIGPLIGSSAPDISAALVSSPASSSPPRSVA
jgi:MFS family permease